MPQVNATEWHQYDYWNCPEDVITSHASGERRKIWNGRVNQKGLKKYTAEEQQQIVADWKKHREDNGSVDFQHGGDACGPTALGIVLNGLGESIEQKKIVHAKHTLAYWPNGNKDGLTWTKMSHAWDVGGRPDGTQDGKSYLRMDSANPTKLMRMGKYLIGAENAAKYEWSYKGNGGFDSQDAALDFIKECIDGGYPLIVSYIKGPCTKIGSKLQGSGGHYVVVIGYDDDHVIVADPACGSIESLKKNEKRSAAPWFKYWSGGYQDIEDPNFDGGFMGAWERRGYAYLLIKPKDATGGNPEDGETANPIQIPVDTPIDAVPGNDLTVNEPEDGIKKIQYRLKHLPRKNDASTTYLDDEVDGVFGKNSKQAVKDFQSDYGLVADGIPGPKTKAKLEEVWVAFVDQEAEKDPVAGDEQQPYGPPAPPPTPNFLHGHWSTGFASLGDTVQVYLETEGLSDGTPVTLEIWEHDYVGSDDFIKTVVGVVENNAAIVEVPLDASDEEWGEWGDNEFYFIAKAGGAQRKFETMLDVAV